MVDAEFNVRYDIDIIGDFLKESGENNLRFTKLLEGAEKYLVTDTKDDEGFVNKFNELVGTNRDFAMLLAVHMISDYDDIGEKSKERIRDAVSDAVMGSPKDLLESKFELLRSVSGRLATSLITDEDNKLLDLLGDLIEYKSKDLDESSPVLIDLNNHLSVALEKKSHKKETP